MVCEKNSKKQEGQFAKTARPEIVTFSRSVACVGRRSKNTVFATPRKTRLTLEFQGPSKTCLFHQIVLQEQATTKQKQNEQEAKHTQQSSTEQHQNTFLEYLTQKHYNTRCHPTPKTQVSNWRSAWPWRPFGLEAPRPRFQDAGTPLQNIIF